MQNLKSSGSYKLGRYMLLTLFLLSLFLIGRNYQLAQAAPTSGPPGSGGGGTTTPISLPLTQSSTTETKTGGLIINGQINAVSGIKFGDNTVLNSSAGLGAGPWADNGTDTVSLNGVRNVGVGTANPGYKVDVLGDVNASADLRGARVCINGVCQASWPSAGLAGAGTSNYLSKWNGAALTNSTIFDNGTNIGVGTATPSAKLNIFDAAAGPIINLQGLATGYRGLKIADTTNTESWFAGANSSNNFVIRRDGGTDDLTDVGGNIGIGTSNPQAPLHVSGQIIANNGLASRIDTTAGGVSHLMLENAAGNFRFVAGLIGAETGSNAGSDFMIWRYNDLGAFLGSALRINRSTGFVGINNVAPTAMLDVGGGITSSGIVTTPQICLNGTCRTTWPSSAGITGNGVAGYLSRWVDASSQQASTLFDDNTNGFIGVGTTTPKSSLDIETASVAAIRGLVSGQASADANGAFINLMKSRNGNTIQNGDSLGSLAVQAFDGSSYVNSARIKFISNGAIGTNSIPTDIQILTGSNGGGTEAMRITSAGRVGIGIAAPNTKFNVYDATTGPILDLQGLTSNYRGLKIADTANAENWFVGANNSNNFVIRSGGTTDRLTIDSAGLLTVGGITQPAGWQQMGANHYVYDGYLNGAAIPAPSGGYTTIDIGGPLNQSRDYIWSGEVTVAARNANSGFAWDVNYFYYGNFTGITTYGNVWYPKVIDAYSMQGLLPGVKTDLSGSPITMSRPNDNTNTLNIGIPGASQIQGIHVHVEVTLRSSYL